MDAYPLQSGEAGAERLSVLASVHQSATEALFDRLDVPKGAKCLDVGCGVGAVSRLIAAKFAKDSGSVTGLDIDATYVDVARKNAASFEGRLTFDTIGVYDLDAVGVYDLVYARFLLTHLSDPRQAMSRMIRAVKPGGTLAIEDVDFAAAFSHPPSPDFARYIGWYDTMSRGNGGDPNFGRELYRMATELGVENVTISVNQPTFSGGAGKHLAPTTLEHIGQVLVDKGIATQGELTATLAGLRAYADDPKTILSMPRIFQMWGRVRGS